MTIGLTVFTQRGALAAGALALAWMIANPMIPAGLGADDGTLGAAYARHGADDGPDHDVNDDKGGGRDGRHHGANDDRGGSQDDHDDNPGDHRDRDRDRN